ncbi:hypothetical protein NP233_g274 [Leucocoprinus birnbaumii]|uniref:BRCT domain-containing protein n=1 Tax=Leucocoprinus birnbaumii TaxID=56174 RepID=A0AAD5W2E6_9AGAR|nr:hypothetical protein NP233_g274 [Leucocoprinus birnbaumii]
MGLFDSTRYFLTSSIPPYRQEQLEYALSKNGATKAESIASATHVISDSMYFEGKDIVERLIEEAKEKEKGEGEGEGQGEQGEPKEGIVVVSDYWVDRTLVLGKIQPPQFYSVDPAMLFSGVVACAAELEPHDLEVLSAGISALGGQWRVALTNDVTHLFCITPSSPKYTLALAHREATNIKIVLPHWFDDSVKLGIRALSTEPYEWPDPPLLKDIGVNVDKLGKDEDKEEERVKEEMKRNMMGIAGQFTTRAKSPRATLPENIGLLPVKRGVLDNKRVLLSWTLSLYGSRREAVEAGVRRAGGVVLRYPGDGDGDLANGKERRRDKKEARAIAECDILITRWRSGKAYGKAFKLNKTIGTMAWLYHVESTGSMPRPVDQLLHYPIPRTSIASFVNHQITVTNYTGEAREYLKRIIMAMGATFTANMTGKNTVLIAAYIQGQKCDKARAWSLPIVNHTWLEDCFIQWRNLTMATDKYIMFPPGMDFSKLLGERGVGVRGVELCDEEEMKEDEGSSEEEDEVLTRGIEEDIDMISMPDTDDPGPAQDVDFEDGTTSSISPTKRSIVAASSSPSKRATAAMKISPAKSKTKSVSPIKRRRIVSDDDDEMDVDQPTREDEQVKRHRRNVQAMAVSSDEERAPVTPAKKSKSSPAKKKSPAKKQSSVDLELTDESDEELDGGMDALLKPTQAKKKKQDMDNSDDEAVIRSGKRKKVTRVESSAEEEEEPESKPKKKLVRRLTNETSLELEAARAEGSVTKAKLVRRASKTPMNAEKENIAESPKEGKRSDPPAPKTSGLLKTTRGDARTRVKAKSAGAKARELDSDSEDEVEGLVGGKSASVRGKPKAQQSKPKKGRKSKKVSSSSSEEEDDMGVESQSEEEEPEKASTSKKPPSPLKKTVSVVVEIPHPSSVKKQPPKNTYTSSSAKAKAKAAEEEEESRDEDEDGEVPATTNPRFSALKKSGSRNQDPALNHHFLKPPPLQPPASSPLSVINTPNTAENAESSDEEDAPERLPARRGAAAKAQAKLKEMMPDATKYEQEAKRARKSGGWSSMWERELVKANKGRKKRLSEGGAEGDYGEEASSKKRRRSSVKDGEREEEQEEVEVIGEIKGRPRIKRESDIGATKDVKAWLMTTQVALAPEVLKALQKLGVELATKPTQCTHFIAPSLVRTEKFLCALASAPAILQESWAVKSAQAKQLLPVDQFLLKDDAAEAKYRMKLADAVTRAKGLQGSLFKNKTFYVTPKTKVDVKLLKSVVTAHGGQIAHQQTPTVRIISGHKDRHVISCVEDISIWRPLAEKGIAVYTHEFLLIGVLRQELEWNLMEFRVPGSV